MKISTLNREKAAILCSMAACSTTMRMMSIADNQGYRSLGTPRRIAFLALAEVNEQIDWRDIRANRYAEAEALLRSGWTP